MIRPLQASDFDAVLDIWLRASIQAHDFVPEQSWHDALPAMRGIYLPQAETRVWEHEGEVKGFCSLVDEGRVVAALFVDPRWQGEGIGTRLLAEAQSRHDGLELAVFTQNTAALGFYRKCGFEPAGEGVEAHTRQPETRMRWTKPQP